MCLQRGDPSQRSGRRSAATRPLAASAIAILSVLAATGWLGASAASTAAAASTASPASPPRPVISWKTATPASSPPPLAYATAAYDADNSTVVLFGGRAADGTLSSSTWVWNGSTWAQDHPAHSPPARELASMAFDPTLHQLILFGGQAADGSLLGDTWAWNGASWIQVGAAGPAPGAREAAVLAFEQSGSLLLFGGTGQAGGGDSSSTSSLPGLPAPPTQTALADTWLWTSAGWIRSTASGPPARSGAVAAYDGSNGTTVLFGGEANPTSAGEPKPLADTWVWNRSGWAATKPPSAPPPRFAAAADDFPPLGGPLVLAGDGTSGGLGDAWVWEGDQWVQPAMRGTSSPRIGEAAAYDAASQTMVVFGGEGGGGSTLGDTILVGVVTPPPVPTTADATTTTVTRSTTTTTKPGSAPTTKPAGPGAHRTVPRKSTTTLAPGRRSIVPAPTPALQTNRERVEPGHTVQISGVGFAPGSLVTLSFHSAPAALGAAVVGANGTFSKVVTIPAGAAAGEHHLTATGTTPSGGTAILSAAVTVVAPAHKGISTVDTLALVGLAILIPVAAYLLMAGAGMWRRRRPAPG